MARIAGVDLPRDKRIVIGLTYIYGIGNTRAQKILKDAGVSEDIRVRDLTPEQEEQIRTQVDQYQVEGCLLYTSPSPRDISGSRMPSSA